MTVNSCLYISGRHTPCCCPFCIITSFLSSLQSKYILLDFSLLLLHHFSMISSMLSKHFLMWLFYQCNIFVVRQICSLSIIDSICFTSMIAVCMCMAKLSSLLILVVTCHSLCLFVEKKHELRCLISLSHCLILDFVYF